MIVAEKSKQDIAAGSKLSLEQREKLGQQHLKKQEHTLQLQLAKKGSTLENHVVEQFAKYKIPIKGLYFFQKTATVARPRDKGSQVMYCIANGEVTGGVRNWSEQNWQHTIGLLFTEEDPNVNQACGKLLKYNISSCHFIVSTIKIFLY